MAKAREEQANRDAAAQVERQRLEEIAKAERDERQRVQRELHALEVAKVEAACKAKAEKDVAEAARKKAEAAPDRIKLEKYLQALLNVEVPLMATTAGDQAMTGIMADLSKFEFEATQNILRL